MKTLDEFTRAYITAALWSSNDESTPSGGYPLDDNYGIEDIAPEALERMIADCAKFQAANEALLTEEFCLRPYEGDVLGQAGHDFWLTRNGHGCGFWETSDWEESAGEKLTASSKEFGECGLYVGDDGLIYLA